ncbi:MAG: glycosyltransferase, partial [Chloroflexi bacterium]
IRDRVVMLWNANNTYGFDRIEWAALNLASTVTTVSRYMKFRMWDWGQNPIVIPNGIPPEAIIDADPAVSARLRSAAAAEHMWFKIGRFDPDKRWLMAVSAAALLKRRGRSVKLLMRGGREPHGAEVIGHAINQGLVVRNSASPPNAAELVTLLTATNGTDIINLTTFLDDSLVPLMYSACDAVLANSGHEPFGLVGLEVMAAGGIAVTGATGEDYAEAYRNSVVVETDDPVEIVTELAALKEKPRLAAHLRRRGRVTARDYLWDRPADAADRLRGRAPGGQPAGGTRAPKAAQGNPCSGSQALIRAWSDS